MGFFYLFPHENSAWEIIYIAYFDRLYYFDIDPFVSKNKQINNKINLEEIYYRTHFLLYTRIIK